MKKVLLKDLAAVLNTSPSQVSRALNQKPDVAPEVRRRALELARKMNYRHFSLPSRKTVAVVLPWFSDFYDSLLNPLSEQCEKRDWHLAVIPYRNRELLEHQSFDGVVMLSTDAAAMRWNERHKIPLVVINNFGSVEDHICSVFPDADGEVRAAVGHFIALGHRKIARIRSVGVNASPRELQRGLSAFEQLLEEHGVEGRNYNEATLDAKIHRVRELLADGFTAFLVVISDETPILLRAIREAGKRVPEDVPVITYEARAVSAFQSPPVTTLEYNYPRIVAVALEQLNSAMEGREVASQLIVPIKLNNRCSTAPPPA